MPSLDIPHCSTTTLTCIKPLQVCANSEPALYQPKAGVRVLLISKVQMFFVAFVLYSTHWYSVTLLQLGEAQMLQPKCMHFVVSVKPQGRTLACFVAGKPKPEPK